VLLYRIIFSLVLPFLGLGYLLRVLRKRESWADLAERFGQGHPGAERTIWLHAATPAELQAARPVLISLRQMRPTDRLLVTTNTLPGRDLAASWGLENVEARLAPVDHALLSRAFLRRENIRGLITLENEFWPNRMTAAHYMQIPVAFLGSRITGRSAQWWGRFPIITNQVLQAVRLMAAADADSQDRFVALGLPNPRVAPRIELSALYAPAPQALDSAVAEAFPKAQTWLAASTHPGEEPLVLEALKLARQQRPGLKLILVPRNTARAPEVAGLVSVAGFQAVRRSAGAPPPAGTDVYIADSYGDLPMWYEMAPVTFVGGSLVEMGGHAPYKPMIHGTALIHGPHVGNHRSVYALLDQAGAATRVTDAASLAQAVVALMDPETREAQLQKTRAIPSEEQALTAILTRFVELL
jgi:3-deoxy-D-manno-octulosonic-acid transferase